MNDAPLAEPALTPVERHFDQPLPLSFSEEALWHAHQLRHGTNAYNQSLGFRLVSPDVPALEKAIATLVGRHEVLRTTYHVTPDGVIRRIHEIPETILVQEDYSRVEDAGVRATLLAARLAAQHEKPFELSEGPLSRWTLIKETEDEYCLHLTTHTIVSDGWSFRIIATEVGTLYYQFRRGLDAGLPPLPIQYADYAVWQRKSLTGGKMESLVGYWRRHLEGMPPFIELPADVTVPVDRVRPAGQIQFSLPPDAREALTALQVRERTTAFVVLLALFNVVLHRWSSQPSVVVGIPIENRTSKDLTGMVGLFLDFIGLKTAMPHGQTFAELFRQVHVGMVGGRKHSSMPIALLARELALPLDPRHSPIFQVLFNFRNAAWAGGGRLRKNKRAATAPGPEAVAAEEGAEPPKHAFRPMPVEAEGTAKFDLILNVTEGADLNFALTYDAAQFSRERMVEFGREYVALVREAARDPRTPIDSYSMSNGPHARE